MNPRRARRFETTTWRKDLMMKTTALVLMVAAVMAVLTTTPAAADSVCGNRPDLVRGPRLTILGLTADQRLVRFRECNPGQLHEIGSVYGLQAPDNALVGIDFRVQDGQLYGVGNGGGIYTLDTHTAAATLASLSPLDVSLDGDFFGVDFNPAANALRIISNTGQNLRHPFAGALAGQTQTDTVLNYNPGPPPVVDDRPHRGRLYE